jgi:hypothetical protein
MAAGTLPRSISKPGEVPARFKDYTEVISVCSQMVQADNKRAGWRAEYEKLWGGNPTYSLKGLKDSGQSWRARANYRELEGVVSSEQTLDYDLETEVDSIIDIDLDFGNGQEKRDWEDCIEQEFTWLIRQRWDDYNFHIPFRIFQKLLHGMGTHIWPDVSGNWIPRTPRAGHVLFPDDCPFNFNEDGDYFMTRDFLPANVLYRKIANEKEAHEVGWRPDAVWRALAESSGKGYAGSGRGDGWRPDELVRSLRSGDIGYAATNQAGVWINTIFVREFETGKISQYAVAEREEAGGYLFEKRNRFDDFSDILVTFPYDIGDGTMHGVKGLGPRLKVFFELSNRIKNAMADQVMLSAYPHFRQLQPGLDPDKLKLMRVGAMTIAPHGLEEIISKYPPLDNGPLALSRELGQTMRSNNRGSMGGSVVEQQDRMTAEEYAMRQQDANRLSNGSVSLQRSNLRKTYQKMLFAALKPTSSNAPWAKMAREFQERLVKKGVPRAAFGRIDEVRAKVNAGKGSASAQLHSLMTLMQTVYPATSDDRKVAIERDITAALFGYSNVDRYARSVNDNDMPDSDDSFIVLENDALSKGGKALAAPKQNQIQHLEGHLSMAQEIVQAVQQGQMDPREAYAAIFAIGIHCSEHLKFLQGNPMEKEKFGQLYNQWQALSRIADKLKSDIESAEEATPPEQQISENERIGLAKIESDERVKTKKVDLDAARKMRQLQFNERWKSIQNTSTIQNQSVKTGSDIRNASAKTGAEIQLKAADTVASIATQRAKSKAKPNGATA